MGLHVTVVVPAYNTATFISECLNSILVQDYTDYDVIVVNDGSTDQTEKVVEGYLYTKRVNLLSLPKHVNVTEATRIGLQHAKGPIITIVDSDDKIFVDALSVMAKVFKANHDVGFAWSRFMMFNGGMGWARDVPCGKSMYDVMMRGEWWNAPHHKFFRKSVYDLTPGLNSEFDRASDFQLVLLLAWIGCRVLHVEKATYWYRRMRPGSLSSQGRDKQRVAVNGIRKWVKGLKNGKNRR